ncbi:hypothetical protein [Streptomyces adustus]|uniref:hypothetical protein n=1 Tax=Streptomyces adustus TaxID=1609272 RepID=UPI00371A31C2
MTLLVLAPSDDETARMFCAFAAERGHRAVMPRGFNEVCVTVTSGRDASYHVDLRVAGEQVRGVLHRGIGAPGGEDGDAMFAHAEALAVWWSALALWQGPTVNRATRQGFLPPLDPLLLARVPGVTLPPSSLGRPLHAAAPAQRVNVHRERDGRFLGRDTEAQVPDEILRFTLFDPDRVRYVLLAGDQVFEPSETGGIPAVATRAALAPLLDRLRSLGADFCLLVLEPTGGGWRLLHVSALPTYHQFEPVLHPVFQALLDRLLAGPP